ncbi:MAG: HDOD domain-containing protein [Alteromonadaceae bacterium]|nr:HDOD domain-containing protein [Alteromonadaceae bacterium]
MSKTIKVDDKVLADIGRGFTVPARPELLLKLQDLMAQNDTDLNEIADTITLDVAISATILKTVNSPLYGLARSISDIKKSVRYLGISGIYSLVTSCLLKQGFSQDSCSVALDEFWQNSSNIANISVFIGKQIKQNISSEKLFTIGLFHDCGIPVMAIKYDHYQHVLDFSLNNPTKTLPEIEEKQYQINHATLGYYVASSWRLPKDICQLILRHHERDFLNYLDNSEMQLAFSILKMAENIAYQHKHFCDCADWHYLQDTILTVLDIDEDQYKDIIEDISEKLI